MKKYDSEGNLIDSFELSGRNVELGSSRNITVTAGSRISAIPNTKIDVPKFYAYAVTDISHSFILRSLYKDINVSSGKSGDVAPELSSSVTGTFVNTNQIETKSQYVGIDITNSDTVSHVYDVVLGGVN